ncbi:hypothetical protein H0H87_008970 [Tephrocybe sp. NHM501043]|nr:hypothetical protein H0H87_008970 [Tephrocybe sp. NHM501043]
MDAMDKRISCRRIAFFWQDDTTKNSASDRQLIRSLVLGVRHETTRDGQNGLLDVNRTIQTSDVDVLIIGAGPAGLMACNALARAGITVRIVDKRPVKVAAGQADGIQPRTIEVLQSYGLAERLLAEANQMHQVAFYNPNPETGGIELTDRTPDVQDDSTPYPFEATLHQGAIEDIFLDSMKSHGVEVSRPVIPMSIQISQIEKDSQDPDAHPVRVVLKRLDALDGQTEMEIVHAKYVVGADGAHSWVRKTLGIAMEGEQTDYVWGVVDMIPDTDFPDIRNKSAIHSNHGSCMLIPREGNKVRLYIQLGSREGIDATNGRIGKEQMGPEKLLNVARKSMAPYTIRQPKTIDWWTIYRIGQRVAARYSVDDRVFIAGDACHTHSPKAGQGMNASMNDTHNLAWKLIHVIRGWGNTSLLKTYELERRKYAQDLISFDKQFAKMFSGKIRTVDDSLGGISAQEFTNAFHTFGGFTSGIGIRYQESSLVHGRHQEIAPGLIIGKRLPAQRLMRAADGRPFELQNLLPADTRFKVLIFTGNLHITNQRANVTKFAADIDANHHFLKPSGGNISTMFHVLTITSRQGSVHYTELPELLRPHWSSVFVDKQSRTHGGDVYMNYGVGPAGAIVVVRPDGYIGSMAPFERVADLDVYFDGFMR